LKVEYHQSTNDGKIIKILIYTKLNSMTSGSISIDRNLKRLF